MKTLILLLSDDIFWQYVPSVSPWLLFNINSLSVNLLSSDHPNNEFQECLNDLVSVSSALEAEGLVIILGDFNAHLCSPRNCQGDLHHTFRLPCTSCVSKGPRYTFSGKNMTVVDYSRQFLVEYHRIMLHTSLSWLNFSDPSSHDPALKT